MPTDEEYYAAQVCLNGHLISGTAEYSPESSKGFCTKCGSKMVTVHSDLDFFQKNQKINLRDCG